MTSATKNIILAATDFTHIGDNAIDNAAQMTKILHGRLVILHIINSVTKSSLRKQNKGIDFIEAKLKEQSETVKQLHGIETEYMVREGSIFSSIGEAAKDTGALLLFIGTHGKKGVQYLMGSFILKVIKSSPAPVFSIQQGSGNNSFKNFIYPLDLDLGSRQKVKWAVNISKLIGSTFHIFVNDPADKSLKLKVRADLNQIEKIMDQHGVAHTVTFSNPKGSFASQIIQFAVDKKADAIMISTDPGNFSWALFGSPDERVIYNLEKIPVLCINAKDLRLIVGGL